MPRRLSQCAALSLLAVYGVLALLGHGGTHVVQDLCGVAHDHAARPAAPSHHHDSHDGHGHCCHHHAHQHAEVATHDHAQEHGSHHHDPHHDPNDCVVCHYFATAAVQQWHVPQIAGEQLEVPSTQLRSAVWQNTDRFVQPIRGPPESLC